MRFFVLLGVVSIAAFTVASIVCAAGIVVAWPRCRRRLDRFVAGARARRLLWLRSMPFVAGCVVATAGVGVFIRNEPRNTPETAGIVLTAAAALTGLFCAAAVSHLWRSARAAWRCGRLLRACGRKTPLAAGLDVWVVDVAYPVAAVLGLIKPRLLLSRRIIEGCTQRELQLVLQHETAHIRRRDNLMRVAMAGLPGPLSFCRTGRELEAAWSVAAEEAADEEAAGDDLEARTDLAAVLVRVAAMAEGPAPGWMPELAFFQGTNLETRVRRLLTARSGSSAAVTWKPAAAAFLVLTVASHDSTGLLLYGLIEAAVRTLP